MIHTAKHLVRAATALAPTIRLALRSAWMDTWERRMPLTPTQVARRDAAVNVLFALVPPLTLAVTMITLSHTIGR
jgi:hypothetical protein